MDFEWLRWTGAIILLAMLIIGSYILIKYPLGKRASISRHIASNRIHYVVMALFLTIGGGLFYGFIIFWLVPTYHISPIMYVLLGIGFPAQLALAWVPDRIPNSMKNRSFHLIHLISAGIVALVMMLCLYLFCGALEYLGKFSQIFVILSAIFSTLCIVFYSTLKNTRKYFLFVEATFILFFVAAIFSLIFKL